MTRRSFLTIGMLSMVILSLLVGVIGCQPAAPKVDTSKFGGTAVFTLNGEVSTLSTLHGADSSSFAIFNFTREMLIEPNPKTGEWVPMLATKWTTSADGLTWTFDLRKGVKWHDGQPFTADDVIFTAELIQNPETASLWRGQFVINGKPIKFEKVNDYQFKMVLSEAYMPVLSNLMLLWPVPKHILGKVAPKDIAKSDWARKPVLTGPYKFSEYKAGEYVKLERFDDYWGGKPYLDSIVMRIIPDANSALVAFESGQVDFLDGVPAKDFLRLKKDGKFQLLNAPNDSTDLIVWNNEIFPFSDLKVRKALNTLIDRQVIVDNVQLGLAQVAWSPFTPQESFFNESVHVKYPFNVDNAKQLLAEAGFKPGKDGVLEKDGKRLEFEVWHRSGNATQEQTLLIIQSAMEKAGVKMTLRALEWSVMSKALRAGTSPLPFQAMFTGHGGMGPDPDGFWMVYSNTQASAYVRVANPKVDQLFAQGRVQVDPAKRKTIYEDLQKVLTDEAIAGFLYYRQGLRAYSTRLGIDEAVAWPGLYFQYPGKLYIKK